MRSVGLHIALTVLLLYSCSSKPSSMTAEEYLSWTSNAEELNRSQSIGSVHVETKYLPNDIARAQGEENNPSTIDFVVKIVDQQMGDLLAVSQHDPSSFNRLAYVTGKIQRDFTLVTGDYDTLSCGLAHLERNYGVGPNKLFVSFGLGPEKSYTSFTLLYDDNLSGTGIMKFPYTKDQLALIPTLDL